MNKSITYIVIVVAMLAFQVVALLLMGHSLAYQSGPLKILSGAVHGSEDSQQVFDWYSLSHVLEGVIFYFIAWLLGKKQGWGLGIVFLVAILLQVGWEVFENTYYGGQYYRHATQFTDYYGDSIVNSVADTLCVMIGFWLAYSFPLWAMIGLTVGIELVLFLTIHDNFTLSAIALISPLSKAIPLQGALGHIPLY